MLLFGLINCAVASHQRIEFYSDWPFLSYLSVVHLSISTPHNAKSVLLLPPLPFLTNPTFQTIHVGTCTHTHCPCLAISYPLFLGHLLQ